MCLKNLKRVGEHTFSCLIATIDLVTDCINGLELLGYINSDFIRNNEEKSVEKIWGSLSLFIVFLPGTLIAIPQVLESLLGKQYQDAIFAFFLMLIFPLLFPAFQVIKIMQILISSDRLNKTMEKIDPYLVSWVGAEAYYESFPQLVLQLYILLNGYNVTKIQIGSILFSVVTITNTSMRTDIEMRCHIKNMPRTCTENIKERITNLPCYLSTIAFRAVSFALTIAYLREVSIGTNLFLLMILAIISFKRVNCRSNGEDKFSDAANYCFTNFGVMSVHGLGLDTEENENGKRRQDEEDPTAITKFIRYSNLFSFIHHIAVLAIIMLLGYFKIWKYLEFFEYLEDDQLLLKPKTPTFYWMFSTTILMGCYSNNLLFYREKKLVDYPDKSNKLLT